jgi:hypothetical protein
VGAQGRRRRAAGLGGGGGALRNNQGEFRSEIVGLGELARKLQTGALSTRGKHPQLDAFMGVQSAQGE